MNVRVQSMNRGWRGEDCEGMKRGAGNPQARPGFTLIELMLVLVILATLSAIVVPKFAGQSKRAKIIEAQTTIANFGTALDAFEIAMSRYPTSIEGLLALVERPTSDDKEWQGPYLAKNTIPLDPWGNEYQYRCPGQYNPDGYDLFCYGPDGRLGGDDDITNWSEEVAR